MTPCGPEVSEEMKGMYTLLVRLSQLPAARPFFVPMTQQYSKEQLPGYAQVVTYPDIGISTVVADVAGGCLRRPVEVVENLNHIWDNCTMYLGESHSLSALAATCFEYWTALNQELGGTGNRRMV